MHPEILRELTAQRGREMRARAHQGRLARIAIRAGRRRPNRPDQADGFVLPAVPDYVDGSFRTEPAGEAVASEPAGEAVASEAGQAPASHHAA